MEENEITEVKEREMIGFFCSFLAPSCIDYDRSSGRFKCGERCIRAKKANRSTENSPKEEERQRH